MSQLGQSLRRQVRLADLVCPLHPIATKLLHCRERSDVPLADIAASVGTSTAPTFMALTCRWRSRPQHQSVSYTHLRAHETDSYLVCRLLLEKKKTQKKK